MINLKDKAILLEMSSVNLGYFLHAFHKRYISNEVGLMMLKIW